VLHREQRHQKKVKCDRLYCRRFRTGVDGLWYEKAGDEADGVKNCGEKSEIGDKPIEERNELHGSVFRNVRANGLELGHDRLRQEKSLEHNRGLCWMSKTRAKGFAPRLIYP
jgi:hypothetical protein